MRAQGARLRLIQDKAPRGGRQRLAIEEAHDDEGLPVSDFVAGQTGDQGMLFQQCEPDGGKIAPRPARFVTKRQKLTWVFV